MALRIRLKRTGTRNCSCYRVVVMDARCSRDGKAIEEIGFYNPMREPAEITVDAEKAKKWLANGAQPTDTVRSILKKNGILD